MRRLGDHCERRRTKRGAPFQFARSGFEPPAGFDRPAAHPFYCVLIRTGFGSPLSTFALGARRSERIAFG